MVRLGWISPSLANDLLDCRYRVAWQLDPRFRPLRRPSTFSELGVIAHGIIEDSAHGMFVGDPARAREAVEKRWDERASRAEGELARAWHPAQVPSRDQWPGYHLTKARVMRYVADGATQMKRSSTEAPSTRRIVESPLEDDLFMLRGRPDRVEGPAEARRIVDVKSGLRQAEPTAPQLRQLMLYGHLVETATGDQVEEIVIEDASGSRWTQGFSRSAADSLVNDIAKARDDYNAAAHDGSLAAAAVPSADCCRRCPFRVVCSPYWAALTMAWGHGSAFGVVRRSQRAATGSVLELDVSSPSDGAGAWVVSGVPIALAAPEREIAFADGEFTGAARYLRWRWSTLTWPLLESVGVSDLTRENSSSEL